MKKKLLLTEKRNCISNIFNLNIKRKIKSTHKLNYKLKNIILIFLTLPLFVWSQENQYRTHQHNDTLADSYNLNVKKIHENIYSKIPDYLKKDIYTYMSFTYSTQVAYA